MKTLFFQLFFQKNTIIKRNLAQSSLLTLTLLIAFFCGNFFGIYSKKSIAPFIFIFLTLIILEIVSFLKFQKKINFFQKFFSDWILTLLNSLKRGFLIGILIEAFKVGS